MQVTLKIIDLLTNEESLIACGKAIGTPFHFSYRELNEDVIQEVMIKEETVDIVRKAEIVTHLHLDKNGISYACLETPYGQMQLEAKVESFQKTDNLYKVTYFLLQKEEIVTRQALEMEILSLV